jgi:hypothetical protein
VESQSGKLRHTIEAFDDTIVAVNSILEKINASFGRLSIKPLLRVSIRSE